MRNFKGSNYDSSLTVKEIAKKVRQFGRKEFKDCKFSVTSTFRSIDIDLVSSPELTREYNEKLGYYSYTKYGREIHNKVEDFAESFNFDKSNSMEDYFHVNFYLRISI